MARKPDIITSSKAKELKCAYALHDKSVSLKAFALAASVDSNNSKLRDAALSWLSNKRANPSSPPKGIGRTNGKRGKRAKLPTSSPEKKR